MSENQKNPPTGGQAGRQPAFGGVRRRGALHLPIGTALPALTLPSTAGRDVDLGEVAMAQHVVLFFYPGDRQGQVYPELAGCTPEACAFHAHGETLCGAGAAVFGVSLQSTPRQRVFVQREGLALEMLSDEQEQLTRDLGIPVWTSRCGDRFVDRVTLVFARGRGLARVIRDPTPEAHAGHALEALRALPPR
ncbi:peroxiredoxin [Arhodomonas sp. AD133]|uniref:peroxiredoxin n=1 Tax=Arhodomonas sp. AD133 TaxID=3415009 RepID=UPI003EC08CA0